MRGCVSYVCNVLHPSHVYIFFYPFHPKCALELVQSVGFLTYNFNRFVIYARGDDTLKKFVKPNKSHEHTKKTNRQTSAKRRSHHIYLYRYHRATIEKANWVRSGGRGKKSSIKSLLSAALFMAQYISDTIKKTLSLTSVGCSQTPIRWIDRYIPLKLKISGFPIFLHSIFDLN